MARPKKAKPDETSEPMANDTAASSGKLPSKKQMVLQAMKQGGKRKPIPIQGWIKDNYGVEIPTNHISTIKSGLRKGSSKKPRKSSESNGATPAPKRGKSDTLSVEDIRALKEMKDRIGRDKLRAVLDLLA